MVIRAEHCVDGLVCKGQEPCTFDVTADGAAVEQPEIRLDRDRIILTAQTFEQAREITVRYAWRPYCEVNVYSSAGLPMLPFEMTIGKG